MASITAKWTLIASNDRLRRSSQAVSVLGGEVFIFGGELLPRQPVDNRLDIIGLTGSDIRTTDVASLAPTPRVGAPSTTLNDDTIWIYSGRGGLEMKPVEEDGSLWSYQKTNNQWTRVKPADPTAGFPAGRSYHCIASDGTGKIYVHSGCPEAGRLSDFWVFGVEKKAWTELSPAPGPARGGASIAYLDGKLYRLNGFDGKQELGGNLDVYDEATGLWDTVSYKPDGTKGPISRSVAALVPVNANGGKYLVTMFGEGQPSALGHAGAGKMFPDSWAWDIKQSQWKKVNIGTDQPEPRGWFDADVSKSADGNDTIVVHGGLNNHNERLGDVWELRFE